MAGFSVANTTLALRHFLSRLCEMVGASDATWLAVNKYEASAVPSGLVDFKSIISEMNGWLPSAAVCHNSMEDLDGKNERWLMHAQKEGIDPMSNFLYENSAGSRSCIRNDVMGDGEWADHWYPQKYLAFYGVGERVMMMFPVNAHCESCFIIDRAVGAPAFTSREKFFLHHAVSGIPKLHKQLCAERGVLRVSIALTDRESQTYRLLLTNLSEAEIAVEMNLSSHTVHDHARRLYKKLRVRGRVGLMSMLLGNDAMG